MKAMSGRRHDDVVAAIGRVRQLERHHHFAVLEHLEQLALHAHAGDVLGRAGTGEDGVVLPRRDLVELVQADDADRRQERVVVGRVQEPGDDRIRILADIAGLRIGGDVDDHRRQPQDVLEEQLDEMGLAATGRPDEQVVRFGQQILALGAIQVDALDALDVAIGHQRGHRAPRLVLLRDSPPPPLQLRENLLGRNDGQLANELDEVLEPRLAILLQILHRF